LLSPCHADFPAGPTFEVPGYIAINTLSPSIMDVLTQAKGWFITGGCQTIYTKFQEFLGRDVKLGVSMTASRSKSGTVKVRSLLQMQMPQQTGPVC
jgi:hypothetical protein